WSCARRSATGTTPTRGSSSNLS
ncbi:uncharacterized protein METZ01_LOCUS110742, partial [marine metagenome]